MIRTSRFARSLRLRVVLAGVLSFAVVPAFAQTPNIAGDWDVTIVSPQGANTVRVTLKQDGDKVSGLFKSPQGELPFDGGVLAGNELKFAFSVPFQGAPLLITLTGKVEGPAVAGKADFGGFAEGEWSAKKVEGGAAAAPPAAPAVAPAAASSGTPVTGPGLSGKWDVTLKTQMGDVPATFEFTDASGKLTGTISGPQGAMDLTGSYDGSAVKISFTARTPNGDIPVTLTGDVTGDSIDGKADFGGMASGEWSAKRAKQ